MIGGPCGLVLCTSKSASKIHAGQKQNNHPGIMLHGRRHMRGRDVVGIGTMYTCILALGWSAKFELGA